MSAQRWDAFGSVLGGVGGTAGLVALMLTSQDRLEGRRRKRFAHFPPHTRSTLLQLLAVVDQIEKTERGREWLDTHAVPVVEAIRRLDSLVQIQGWGNRRADGTSVLEMQAIAARSHLLVERKVAGDTQSLVHSTWGVDQREDARLIWNLAQALGRKLAHAGI